MPLENFGTLDVRDTRDLLAELIVQDAARRLAALTAILSTRQRELIQLRYWEDMSFGDISEIMGISKQAVYLMHDRALFQISRGLVRQAIRKRSDVL